MYTNRYFRQSHCVPWWKPFLCWSKPPSITLMSACELLYWKLIHLPWHWPGTVFVSIECVRVWGEGVEGEKVTLSSCSLQVDAVVLKMCLWGNRTYFEMSVPFCNSCVTSSTILVSESWWACQQCQLFYGIARQLQMSAISMLVGGVHHKARV